MPVTSTRQLPLQHESSCAKCHVVGVKGHFIGRVSLAFPEHIKIASYDNMTPQDDLHAFWKEAEGESGLLFPSPVFPHPPLPESIICISARCISGEHILIYTLS